MDARLYSPDHDAKIIHWRFTNFERLGFPAADASSLALRRDIDLHAAADLVAGGCPPHVAMEILV